MPFPSMIRRTWWWCYLTPSRGMGARRNSTESDQSHWYI